MAVDYDIGDVVSGHDHRVHGDFIGRVVRKGGGGLTEILLDNGRLAFLYSKTPLLVVQRYTGPASAIVHDGSARVFPYWRAA